MAEYYLGQIMMTGFGFGQKGFAQCNGQLIGIAQNQALFSLLGTSYGGNGMQNFQLPDLRGRTPAGFGPSATVQNGYPLGMVAGQETVAIGIGETPPHSHAFNASTAAGVVTTPTKPMLYADASISGGGKESLYASAGAGPVVPLLPATIGMAGGNQSHPNMQPYEVINFNIALTGIFPSRN